MSWLKEFLNATGEAEAPDSYFYWSGLIALSASVSNRVYLNKKIYKLYPNLFVFLISKASGLGKGVPVNACKKVLEEAGNTRLIVGQNSIEGIITELGNAYTTDSGRVIATAEATLLAGEFGSFLLDNPKLFTNLTDLYDSQYNEGKWSKRLASKDTAVLKDICLNGLFAANEVHFREALPVHAIKGGFLGRTICVYESKRRQLNDLITVEGDTFTYDPGIYKNLSCYLKKLGDLKGEFIFTRPAAEIYKGWYQSFYDLKKEMNDDTGTAERLRDNILKVAMLLSLAEGPNLRIEQQHIEEAMLKCHYIYSTTMTMVMGEGKSDTAAITKPVLKLLLALAGSTNRKIARKELLMRGLRSGDFNHLELDRVLEHLVQSRILKMESGHGGPWFELQMGTINALLKS